MVNAFSTAPFSDLFYGSNLASIIHVIGLPCLPLVMYQIFNYIYSGCSSQLQSGWDAQCLAPWPSWLLKGSHVKVDGLEEQEEAGGKWPYLYAMTTDKLPCIAHQKHWWALEPHCSWPMHGQGAWPRAHALFTEPRLSVMFLSVKQHHSSWCILLVEVFNLPSRLSFVPKGWELLEGGSKRDLQAWWTWRKGEVSWISASAYINWHQLNNI